MMKRTLLISQIALLMILASNAYAENCSSISKDSPLKKTVASASLWDNARNNKGSIRRESARLINEAQRAASSASSSTLSCPSHCALIKTPVVVFTSIPRKFLEQYSDSSKCKAYYEKTKETPLLYPNRKFSSLDELNNWFNDFSQGKGSDGKDLYKKCDGSCSPQYTSLITKTNDNSYSLTAEVICGPARDKGDNMYNLSTALRWKCEESN